MGCQKTIAGQILERGAGATHETTKVLFRENPDAGDTFSAWKTKLWIAVRLLSGTCERDQNPSCVAPAFEAFAASINSAKVMPFPFQAGALL
jgi:hypothetical protein